MAGAHNAAAPGKQGEPKASVRCLLIPLDGLQLLAPGTTVAEVSVRGEIAPVPGAPEWFIGLMNWRGRRVPLIAFEQIMGRAGGNAARSRVVVFNTLNGDGRMPFLAVLSSGVPRLFAADGGSVQATEPNQDGVGLSVTAAGEPAYIPNLDVLERMVLQLPLG